MTANITKRLFVTVVAALLYLAAFNLSAAWAGPPFVTDDPETVEYRHGEFYTGFTYANNKDGSEGTVPLFELNYGPLTDVQLHIIVPFNFIHLTGEATNYGLGDLELGVKYRFIHETETTTQVGTFPIVTLPTGDSDRGLGSGHVRYFLPVWVQKSWGPWTTYGGGGYWINPGSGNKNYWQIGEVIQREIAKALTVGAELFHFTKEEEEGSSRTGFNVGAIINLTEDFHVLLSAGSDIDGDNRFSTYAAFQWTFGPHGEEEKKYGMFPPSWEYRSCDLTGEEVTGVLQCQRFMKRS